jgi:hypothetical protein
MNNTVDNSELLTKKELKEFLKVGNNLLGCLLRSGRITGIRVGKKKVVYNKQQILIQLSETNENKEVSK